MILNPSIPFTQQQTFVEKGKAYSKNTWSIPSINPFENKLISFSHGNDATVQIADLFTFKGEILASNQDCTALDNTLEQSYLVYEAIDPNDILVSPKGYCEEGYILPTQVLTYTIRFENYGKFPAQKVVVIDDLVNELDINSFKLISSSHENVKTEIEGRILKFVWDDMFFSAIR